MDLQHRFSVPIGIDDAWAAFTDIERIAPCLPGATITSVDGETFEGTAKVKLGPISLQYAGSGRWASLDPSTYSAEIEAQGKDRRGNGTAGATIRAHLEAEGDARTTVVVDTRLRITGRPAQFGRGVVQDVGGRLLDQFAACLAEQLAVQQPPTQPVASEGSGAAPLGPSDATREVAPSAPSAPATKSPPAAPPAGSPPQLGAAVGPVLLKRFGPPVGVVLLLAAVLAAVRRARRRGR